MNARRRLVSRHKYGIIEYCLSGAVEVHISTKTVSSAEYDRYEKELKLRPYNLPPGAKTQDVHPPLEEEGKGRKGHKDIYERGFIYK